MDNLTLDEAIELTLTGEYQLHYSGMNNWYLVFVDDGGPFVVYRNSRA